MQFIEYSKGSEKCKFSFHYGICDSPFIIFLFVINLIFLIPFFYCITFLIRDTNIRNPGIFYCAIASLENIYYIVMNFTTTLIFTEKFSSPLHPIIYAAQCLRILSLLCFLTRIINVLVAFEIRFAKAFLIVAKILYFLSLFSVIFFVSLPYLFTYISLQALLDYKPANLTFQIISFCVISVIIYTLDVLHNYKNIQTLIPEKYHIQLKIASFCVAFSTILTIITDQCMKSHLFSTEHVMNSTKLAFIFIPIYIIAKFSISYTLLAIIMILSKKTYSSEENELSTLNVSLDFTL